MTTVGLCVIGTSTTLESNKSHVGVSSPRRESSPTTFVRGSVAIGYNYPLWPFTRLLALRDCLGTALRQSRPRLCTHRARRVPSPASH